MQRSGLYENDTDNFKNKEYQSTIVSAVRYNEKGNYKEEKETNLDIDIKNDVVGFVCIDSKKSLPNWTAENSLE